MSELIPFRFAIDLHLTELTAIKAYNLKDMINFIKTVPDSSIYCHTHAFFKYHTSISPASFNDFASWINIVLGEKELAEKLESVDIIEFITIDSLRKRILEIMTNYLKENPKSNLKFADQYEEFHFMKLISFVFPTNYFVYNLKEFVDILKIVPINSLYFHVFVSRFRLQNGMNDFSNWLDKSIGNKELAGEINRLDPYSFTLEELRKTIIKLVERKIIN